KRAATALPRRRGSTRKSCVCFSKRCRSARCNALRADRSAASARLDRSLRIIFSCGCSLYSPIAKTICFAFDDPVNDLGLPMSRREWNRTADNFKDLVCDIAAEETNDQLRRFVSAARPSPDKSVLVDLGCGIGTFVQK